MGPAKVVRNVASHSPKDDIEAPMWRYRSGGISTEYSSVVTIRIHVCLAASVVANPAEWNDRRRVPWLMGLTVRRWLQLFEAATVLSSPNCQAVLGYTHPGFACLPGPQVGKWASVSLTYHARSTVSEGEDEYADDGKGAPLRSSTLIGLGDEYDEYKHGQRLNLLSMTRSAGCLPKI